MKIHIGKLIKEAVDESSMSVTEFAKKINYSRRNIYSIFDKESIDTSLLVKIGKALDRNFFIHYSSAHKKSGDTLTVAAEPSGESEYKTKELLLKEIEYLKEINALLKTQLEKLSTQKKRSS